MWGVCTPDRTAANVCVCEGDVADSMFVRQH